MLGLDIIYAEPEESDNVRDIKTWLSAEGQKEPLPSNVVGLLEARLHALDTDQQFAQSVARVGTAVLAMPFLVPEGQTAGPLPETPHVIPEHLRRSEFMLVKQTQSAEESHPYDATAMLPPLDAFAQQAQGLSLIHI